MSNSDYKYFSLVLDPADKDDKKIISWMKKHKSRSLKYTEMIREAMKDYVERKETETIKPKTAPSIDSSHKEPSPPQKSD